MKGGESLTRVNQPFCFCRVNVDLDQVVEVNKDEMTVTVEPSVCIGEGYANEGCLLFLGLKRPL